MCLLTGYPDARPPSVYIAGNWKGAVGELSDGTARTPLTISLTQHNGDLSGTARSGRAPNSISGELSGITSRESVIFTISFFEANSDERSYNFSGEYNSGLTREDVAVQRGSTLEASGSLELTRTR